MTFLLSPLLVLSSGCSDDKDTTAPSETKTVPVETTSSAAVSAAQREWQLSSREQQEEYCRAYTRHDITSPQDLGMPTQDADEEFVKDFLELLKEKC